jgi:hypothetical protein
MKLKITESQLKKLIEQEQEPQPEVEPETDGFIQQIMDRVRKRMGKSSGSNSDDDDDDDGSETTSNSTDQTDFRVTGSTSTDGSDLFNKLKKQFTSTPNDSLVAALVANAYGESNFKCDAKGDFGIKSSRGNKYKPINGYCSFGLWQFNICGGLGIKLLDEYGGDMSVLSDCDRQITFMSNHIKQKYSGYNENHTIGWWIDWIVDNVERPTNKDKAKRKRREWASKTYGTV